MKFAFVGFRHAHIHLLYQHAQAMPVIKIVATCEEDAATRETLARAGDIHITHESLEAMLTQVACEAVAVGDYSPRQVIQRCWIMALKLLQQNSTAPLAIHHAPCV
jgi:hypothetical protein